MSRKLFAFLLSELKTVRIICPRKDCGGVTEVTVERMRSKFQYAECPLCRNHIVPESASNSQNALYRLAWVIEELQSTGAAAQVEFVLPDTADQ